MKKKWIRILEICAGFSFSEIDSSGIASNDPWICLNDSTLYRWKWYKLLKDVFDFRFLFALIDILNEFIVIIVVLTKEDTFTFSTEKMFCHPLFL